MSNTVTIDNPELVIGLVGPIGVDLDAIVSFLENALKDVAYRSQVIHITKVMRDLLPHMKVEEDSYSARYRSLISNADTVRRTIDNQAALACLAISEIRRLRQELQPTMDPKVAREAPLLGTAFIIRQFKREEEIALLRQVYGRKLIQISVFSDKEERRAQLVKKIKEYGTGTIEEDDAEKQAIDLISIDNNETSDEYGQRVSDVFHRGDVFVRGEVNQGSKIPSSGSFGLFSVTIATRLQRLNTACMQRQGLRFGLWTFRDKLALPYSPSMGRLLP